ncbi:MAG TPA: transporter [Pantanalinema sp.]
MIRILTGLGVGAIALGAIAPAAQAYTINMGGTWVAPAGRYELLEIVSALPYDQRVSDGGLAPLQPGYLWGEAYTSLEVGLGNDLSTALTVPYDAIRPEGQGTRHGLSDVGLSLSRRLWKRDGSSGRLRLRATLPTGNAQEGLGAGTTGLALQHSQAHKLTPNLQAVFNLNAGSALPGTASGGTRWSGCRFDVHAGLITKLSPSWYACLEGLSNWQTTGTLDGTVKADTSSSLVQIAPGLTYLITPDVAVQASVLLPVMRQATQDAYPVGLVLASSFDF